MMKFEDVFSLGAVNSKKFCPINVFQQILSQKQLIHQAFFPLNLELQDSLKLSGSDQVDSTLLNKSCSFQKILTDLLLKLLKPANKGKTFLVPIFLRSGKM